MNRTAQPLPRIIVLPPAWEVITAELDRADRVSGGGRGSGDEVVFVPLCAPMWKSDRTRAPALEDTELSDLDALVVAHVLIPPRELVNASAARIKFRAGRDGWAAAQQRFDNWLAREREAFPRLDLLARGHSHPFHFGRTRPSGPDRIEHLAPCLRYNRTRGILAGFTLIAIQNAARDGWALHGFATTDVDDLLDLGLAQTGERPARVSYVRRPPYYRMPQGEAFEAALATRSGYGAVERLPLGWTRCRRLNDDGEVVDVLALPPDFPGAVGRRFSPGDVGWTAQDVLDWRAYFPLDDLMPRRKPSKKSAQKGTSHAAHTE